MIKTIKNGILTSLALLFVGVGLVASPVGAVPVTLDTLIPGGSITVGDKYFDNFDFYIATAFGTPVFPTSAAGISVEGLFIGGLPGLQFTGGMHAGANTIIDFIIKYDVKVVGSNQLISDIHLGYNGGISGSGFSNVVEDVWDSNGVNLAHASVSGNSTPPDYSDPFGETGDVLILSTPQKKVSVTKDVQLLAGQTGFATISLINQAVSQTQVPEPTTLILLGSGLTALGVFGRKGKKA